MQNQSTGDDIQFNYPSMSAGNAYASSDERSKKTDNNENDLDFVITKPIVLAKSEAIHLSNEETIGIFIEMLNGRYGYNYDYASMYDREWSGEFRISVYYQNIHDDSYLLSTLPLNTIGYDHFFSILIDDYTGNGQPDFTVAVNVIGSQGRYYRTYTIDPDYSIRELEFEDVITEGLFVFAGSVDSIRFIQKDGEIELYVYDNLMGELNAVYYSWNGSFFSLTRILEDLMENSQIQEKRAFAIEHSKRMAN
jgi:hypothetical protein